MMTLCEFNKPLWLVRPNVMMTLCDFNKPLWLVRPTVMMTLCEFNKPLWLVRPTVMMTMYEFNNPLWLVRPTVMITMCDFNNPFGLEILPFQQARQAIYWSRSFGPCMFTWMYINKVSVCSLIKFYFIYYESYNLYVIQMSFSITSMCLIYIKAQFFTWRYFLCVYVMANKLQNDSYAETFINSCAIKIMHFFEINEMLLSSTKCIKLNWHLCDYINVINKCWKLIKPNENAHIMSCTFDVIKHDTLTQSLWELLNTTLSRLKCCFYSHIIQNASFSTKSKN